jgi:hypothetical protein
LVEAAADTAGMAVTTATAAVVATGHTLDPLGIMMTRMTICPWSSCQAEGNLSAKRNSRLPPKADGASAML